jgi:ATP-dependent exoDNAse (exonuclease V) alpha subunit
LNEAQNQILERLEQTSANVYVSGEAGTGKSLLLREFVASTRKTVAVCAPTGLAATNVDGVTIHSLFRLPVDTTMIGFAPQAEPDVDRVLASLDAVVIDEASMVRADMLDAIDARLRVACESSEPFGGVQMLMFGDVMQLPPVVTPDAREALGREYPRSPFFFDAHVAASASFTTCELTEVMRQRDPTLIAALSAARIGRISTDQLALLNANVRPDQEHPPRPVLATRNDVVDKHNERGLASLEGKAKSFLREWRAAEDAEAPRDAPCERLIRIKPGCPVLFTRNDPELGVSNGTSGVVTAVDDDVVTVEVDGVELEVEPALWPVRRYSLDATSGRVKLVEVGAFLQLPLRLGFALTIHRAQGQTYEQATIDFSAGSPFVDGHGYVAVSRVRSLEGLTLTRPLRAGDFRASRGALAFIAATRGS